MKLKLFLLLILSVSAAGTCFAQSREPSIGSESSSVGPSPNIGSDNFSSSSDVGYDSGNHGNVN